MKFKIQFGVTFLAFVLTIASVTGNAQDDRITRAGIVSEAATSITNTPAVPNATFNENFEASTTTLPVGWVARNQSTVIGSNPNCWNAFTAATPWPAHGGVTHAGANFNCTSGNNTISGWLLTPQITGIQNGDVVRFWTRKGAPDSFADRLELRLCLDTTADSCGLATSTGSGDAAVGSFTTLLLTVNPTLILGVYPVTYTEFTATVTGVPVATNGRLGFRYFVTSGGPAGANSDILSIDDVSIASGSTPPQFTYNPAPAAAVNFTGSTAIGGTANGSIAVTIGTAGVGTGAPATTTTTCTAPTGNFAGFAQAVSAIGPAAATSGGPLAGTCTLTGVVQNQTLTCNEVRGTAPAIPRTFNLTCPAGLAPLTSVPATTTAITLPAQTLGGAATTSIVTFSNPRASNASVSCTSTAPEFTVNSPIAVNAAGSGVATINYTSAAAGTFTGTLNCGVDTEAQTFTFPLSGTTTATPLTSAPTSSTAITLPVQTLGGASTTSIVTFTNPGLVLANVTCSSTAGQFTVNSPIAVAAGGGTGVATVTYTSAAAGTFTGTLNCNAGAQAFSFPLSGTTNATPITSAPATGGTLNLPPQAPSGPATTATISFQNPGLVPVTVTCAAPAATQFTVTPSVTVNPSSSGTVTVTYSSAALGAFTGTLTCTAGAQSFNFSLRGTTAVLGPVSLFQDKSAWLLILMSLSFIGLAFAQRRSA